MENKKSLRSSQMRSLGIEMGAAIVNSLTPISATTTQTPLDKILNNFYIDSQNQFEIVDKIYYMLQTSGDPSRYNNINYNDLENLEIRRLIIIYNFLNDYEKDITSFFNLMDRLINTNWVIDTQRMGGPFKDIFYLTSTEYYTLLNKLVDFYDKNKNILKTDFFILDLN
jgi:hypothetical protein